MSTDFGAVWRDKPYEEITARIRQFEDSGLQAKYQDISEKYGWEKSPYAQRFTAASMIPRIVMIALIALTIVSFWLLVTNHFFSLPREFIALFQHVDYTKLAIGCVITVTLITGASFIIHRARTKHEPLLAPKKVTYFLYGVSYTVNGIAQVPNDPYMQITKVKTKGEGPQRGAFSGIEPFLETAWVSWEGHAPIEACIDRSTLDNNGNGEAFIYYAKDSDEHYSIAAVAGILGTLAYLIGVIAYNVFRAVIAPLYILIQCLREVCCGQLYPKEREFKLLDIGTECWRSILAIVEAFFYCLAYFMAILYAMVKPFEGCKLAAAIERDWNEGRTTEESYWIRVGERDHWQMEGGGGPNGMGRFGLLVTGCYHPFGIVEITHGKVTGYRITSITDPRTLVDVNYTQPTFYNITTISSVKREWEEYKTLLELKKEKAQQ